MSKFAFKHTLIFQKFWPYFTFLLVIQSQFYRKAPHSWRWVTYVIKRPAKSVSKHRSLMWVTGYVYKNFSYVLETTLSWWISSSSLPIGPTYWDTKIMQYWIIYAYHVSDHLKNVNYRFECYWNIKILEPSSIWDLDLKWGETKRKKKKKKKGGGKTQQQPCCTFF